MSLTRREFVKTTAVGSLGAALIPGFASGFEIAGTDRPTDIGNMTVRQLSSLVHKKKISSYEVVHAFINRIEAVNPKINAVVAFRPDEALKEARKADEELRRRNDKGVLHGIPCTIKDSFETAGIVSTGGTLGRRNFLPAKDATVVKRLKDAGAIIMGKTNTPEFTMDYFTDNLVYGRTKNPYDLNRSPGGSSGGAAAIIAMRGSPFDIGTDTGGSIRFPAHCCGIAALKATSGRVPRTGHIISYEGMSQSLTQVGPLANNVDDLYLLLNIISGVDHLDPYIYPVAQRNYTAVNLKKLRFAYYDNNGLYKPSDETIQSIKKAANIIARSGININEDVPKETGEIAGVFGKYLNNNFQWLRGMLALHGTTETSLTWIKETPELPLSEYNRLVEKVNHLRSSVLSFWKDYDVLVCPVSPMPALLHDTEVKQESDYFSYSTVFNVTGWPSVVIRGGTSADGLPIGIQIVAPPWREDICLAAAKFLEKELGPWKTPAS